MVLLRNSILSTKKFFQKTIDNFKSILSIGTNSSSSSTYERLPKTPPFYTDMNHISTGYKDLDNFYAEFTHQWDSNKSKLKNKGEKKSMASSKTKVAVKQIDEIYPDNDGHIPKINHHHHHHEERREDVMKSKRLNTMSQGMKITDLCSRSVREKRLSSVAQKLKELELMDKGNADHKLDIEEVLHYYSRLTCPAYLDIVDKFFAEMCAEFLGPRMASPLVNSTPKLP